MRTIFVVNLMLGLTVAAPVAGNDVNLVVSIRLQEEGDLAKAKAAGTGGVVCVVGEPGADSAGRMSKLVAEARSNGLEFWIGVRFSGKTPAVECDGADGLALIFASPNGEPASPDDFDALMNVKRRGDRLGEAVRQIKKKLGPGKKLAICVAASEVLPETARKLYVPVGDLVRDGTLDVVCLSNAERFNFHRMRLLRDAPLRAGVFLDGAALEKETRIGLLRRTVPEAIKNDTCETLWVTGFGADLAGRVVRETREGYQRNGKQRQALEAAIADGLLSAACEVAAEAGDNQATVHGVAQSFRLSRDGHCPLVQVYAALRGCQGPLPPPLKVELRTDEDDKPAGRILAATQIDAAEFGHEPTYRWGTARFDPPVKLSKDVKYWIHLPKATHTEGNYVWRMVGDGANKSGNAWSSRYDYAKHSWVFRVLMKKEAPR